jgi:MFS family permease
MSATAITVFIGWLVALAIFFGFIVLLRYIQHIERMAMITSGLNPNSIRSRHSPRYHRSRGMLRAGLITAMVGLTLTIGLYPIGYFLPPFFGSIPFHLGPWLLPGLIPLGVGAALIISYYLERDNPPMDSDEEEPITPKIRDITEEMKRKQGGE